MEGLTADAKVPRSLTKETATNPISIRQIFLQPHCSAPVACSEYLSFFLSKASCVVSYQGTVNSAKMSCLALCSGPKDQVWLQTCDYYLQRNSEELSHVQQHLFDDWFLCCLRSPSCMNEGDGLEMVDLDDEALLFLSSDCGYHHLLPFCGGCLAPAASSGLVLSIISTLLRVMLWTKGRQPLVHVPQLAHRGFLTGTPVLVCSVCLYT